MFQIGLKSFFRIVFHAVGGGRRLVKWRLEGDEMETMRGTDRSIGPSAAPSLRRTLSPQFNWNCLDKIKHKETIFRRNILLLSSNFMIGMVYFLYFYISSYAADSILRSAHHHFTELVEVHRAGAVPDHHQSTRTTVIPPMPPSTHREQSPTCSYSRGNSWERRC